MSQRHRFYSFGYNVHGSGYTWAANIVPRSAKITRVCNECGAFSSYLSGAFDVIVEGGSRYPDVLGCGAYPFLIVSENVIDAWQAAGINPFHTYPVGVAEVHSKRLRDIAPPAYFRVEIDGQGQVDFEASDIPILRICPECQRVTLRRQVLVDHWEMVPGSWDGSPLFRDAAHYPCVSFCTELVLELASRYQLTNFRFEPTDQPTDLRGQEIDYLKGKKSRGPALPPRKPPIREKLEMPPGLTITEPRPHGPLNEQKLQFLEAQLGAQLPSDYRGFLVEYNGGSPVPNGFWIEEGYDGTAVNKFYGLHDGTDEASIDSFLDDRSLIGLPEGLIVIGDDGLGNLICLGVIGNEREGVYFLDHDSHFPDMADSFDGITEVADTFSDFLAGLFQLEYRAT